MNFKRAKVSDLKPAAYNPRKDLKEEDPEYKQIERSMTDFGDVQPIVINKDNTVISGHQRLKIYKKKGIVEIDVVQVDVPKDTEKLMNVALNKIGGSFDTQRLTDLLGELKAEGMDISITGFDDAEFQSLLNELNNPEIPGASVVQAKQKLTEKFIVPPFSVLDTRQGYWQQRKAYWIALGIKSELGRGGQIDKPAYSAHDTKFGVKIW